MLQVLGDLPSLALPTDVAKADKLVTAAWANYNNDATTLLSSIYAVAWQDPTGKMGPTNAWRVLITDNPTMQLSAYVTTSNQEAAIEYPWVGLTLQSYFQAAQQNGVSVKVRQYTNLVPSTSVGVDVTL